MIPLPNASCVAIGGRGLLIEGEPGSGKSSLALALIDRGAILVGDDGVLLEERAGRLIAHPATTIAGKLEIRGVGIAELPATSAPLGLRIRLSAHAPRFVDTAERSALCGTMLPSLTLYPDLATLPLRCEWAMRLHGLPG